MMDPANNGFEKRVLLVAPTSKDGEITCALMARAGVNCILCSNLHELTLETKSGVGAILLTEEAVTAVGVDELVQTLNQQPNWSDTPVVMLMRGGGGSQEATRVLSSLRNVTLLERPAPMRSVVSAVQAALRARERQYELRQQFDAVLASEARARALQEQLEIAVQASELGTFHCDMPLNKIVWNERCKAHFWLPPDAEVDFDLFYSIIHPDDRERTRQAIDACVNERQPYDVEYRTVSPTGQTRWIRATGRTYYDQRGRPLRFDGTTQDVTEQRARREERERLLAREQEARRESERAGRIKDEFLATLSHELRTPLNAILGWSQLIRTGSRDEATLLEGLSIIERNARVQVQLIEDLLDMSRIVSGKVRLEVGPITAESFVDAAIETVTPAAEAKGVRLEKVYEAATAALSGDPNRLQQVIWNLLSNAIKFTPRGGRVQVALRSSDNHVEIAVRDTGKGIQPEFLPHVFERFRQADASTTRAFGGLGLGLAIVKHLVELHGGTIGATSAGDGQGSTFTVRLPISVNSPEPMDEKQSPKLITPSAKGLEDCASLKGLTVLVVDDEPDARRLMKWFLEHCEATVLAAGSADEALAILQEEWPDVLVTDIGMPGVDGYTFLRRLRELEATRGERIPAIALTAFARSEDRLRALRAGFSVHITKPVEPTELIATIASVAADLKKHAPRH